MSKRLRQILAICFSLLILIVVFMFWGDIIISIPKKIRMCAYIIYAFATGLITALAGRE